MKNFLKNAHVDSTSLVIILFPQGRVFPSVTIQQQEYDFIRGFREEVMDYCRKNLQGPWQSDELDILYNGVRIRLGSKKDRFLLTLKYDVEEYI